MRLGADFTWTVTAFTRQVRNLAARLIEEMSIRPHFVMEVAGD
jgi:hypothetical protein